MLGIRVLVVAFLAILVLGLRDARRSIAGLGPLADAARSSVSDQADEAGAAAGAFRRARALVHEGDRFALVVPKSVGRDQAGLYRLVALSYLYPAIAVSDPARADLVMVFGNPSPAIRTAFDEVDVVSGVWLGRRT